MLLCLRVLAGWHRMPVTIFHQANSLFSEQFFQSVFVYLVFGVKFPGAYLFILVCSIRGGCLRRAVARGVFGAGSGFGVGVRTAARV